MLSVDSIARVVVNAVASAASPAAFDTGLLLIKDPNYTAARRLATCDGYSAAMSQLTTWGFAASSEPAKCVTSYFSASPAPSRILLSCYPSSESLIQALSEVLNVTDAFYGIGIGTTETEARILALSEHIDTLSTPKMLFAPIVGTASAVVGPTALLAKLFDNATDRAFPMYSSTKLEDAVAAMGAAMGLELSHQNSSFSMCYKRIYAISPAALTETQAETIKALNGNVYSTRGYYHDVLEKGSVSSGKRYDEILYIDKISDELKNAAVMLLAENEDKMPQTDDSTALFINYFSSILSKYTDRKVLASGPWRGAPVGPLSPGDAIENGYVLWADSFDYQSDADRMAHKAMPIYIGLVLAGSIESIVITINVVL